MGEVFVLKSALLIDSQIVILVLVKEGMDILGLDIREVYEKRVF